ncbi:MAG: Trm112 family protein [Polyangia bacterium]|jgi:uncharacterized protein YbaR (Trm112 family)|nr:Trm112 family protein [Polyangia bacterium]
MTVDPKLMEILACPKCKGSLEHEENTQGEAFVCHACKLRYRVEDEIPNFLIDDAERLGD